MTRALLAALIVAGVAGPVSNAATVTYHHDIAPLIADRCVMCHHPGGSAPFSLLHLRRRQTARGADRDGHRKVATCRRGRPIRPTAPSSDSIR